jgi:hypothetical protein
VAQLTGGRRRLGGSLCQKRLVKGEARKFSILADGHFRGAHAVRPFNAGDAIAVDGLSRGKIF